MCMSEVLSISILFTCVVFFKRGRVHKERLAHLALKGQRSVQQICFLYTAWELVDPWEKDEFSSDLGLFFLS